MSTQAQILANRQNASHSSGPKTPEGKAASSANATRHGLSGIFTVLPHENREEFETLAAAIRDEFKPQGDSENFLIGEMIQARCKLLRLQRLESAAHEQILTEPGSAGDPDARILDAMGKSGNLLDKLERYAASARRCYYKALHELQVARKAKIQNEAKQFEVAMRAATYVPMPSCAAGSQPAAGSQSASVNEPISALRAALLRDNPALQPLSRSNETDG